MKFFNINYSKKLKKIKKIELFGAYEMKDLESEEKIAIDIAKLESHGLLDALRMIHGLI